MERALSGLLLAGFILLPGAFLYAFFRATKVCCLHLSDAKFFEPVSESVSFYLLALLGGLFVMRILHALGWLAGVA